MNKWCMAAFAAGTIVAVGRGGFAGLTAVRDVSTPVDLAAVDPATRQWVIRAGGTDLRHGNTTPVDADPRTREAGLAGFSAATEQMTDHFDVVLTKFETDVKSGTASVRVQSKYGVGTSGGGGGGALDGIFLALLAVIMLHRAATRI